MTSVLIVGFISGLIVANGLPHFIKGITGKEHYTPFGASSSAVVNVVWGWFNFVVAALLWHLAPMRFHPRAAFFGTAVGVLIMGIFLAQTWSKERPSSRREK